jgi:hypothetical protein
MTYLVTTYSGSLPLHPFSAVLHSFQRVQKAHHFYRDDGQGNLNLEVRQDSINKMLKDVALVRRTYDQMAWNVLSLIHLDSERLPAPDSRLDVPLYKNQVYLGGPPNPALNFMHYVNVVEEDNQDDTRAQVAAQDALDLPFE